MNKGFALNKGFTLIEVLGVILVLGIIASIAVPTITNNIEKSKEMQRQSVIDNAIVAAKSYVQTNDGTAQCYSLAFLKEHGYIKSITDPTTGNDMTGSICVTEEDNVFKYAYSGTTTPTEPDEPDEPDEPVTGDDYLATGLSVGSAVYVNPQTGRTCENYANKNSLTNVKTGCLKWYVLNNTDSSTYDLILDHNAVASIQRNTNDKVEEPNNLTAQLNELFVNSKWDLKPRVPTADEIAHLTGADRDDTIKWNSSKTIYGTSKLDTQIAYYYLDGYKNANNNSYTGWQKQYANATTKSEFAWLYDNLKGCKEYGCNIEADIDYATTANPTSDELGYWTSNTIIIDTYIQDYHYYAWYVTRLGLVNKDSSEDTIGIRPIVSFYKAGVNEKSNSIDITPVNTPSLLENSYASSQKMYVKYHSRNTEDPQFFVKTTKAGTSSLSVTESCGTSTNPETCTTITSTKSLTPNTWYKVSGDVNVTYNTASNTNETIYATIYDGEKYIDVVSGELAKIDKTNPSIEITAVTILDDGDMSIVYNATDPESGISHSTLKYGTTEGNYTSTISNYSGTVKISKPVEGTMYYFQICTYDKAGNGPTCTTGSKYVPVTGTLINPVVSFTNTPETEQNGYLKSQVANVTFASGDLKSPQYYIKTTKAGTSSLSVTSSCGTDTMPGTCSSITSTTSLAANTWYKVSGTVNVTYTGALSTNSTIYAVTSNGTDFSGTTTGALSKIDTTSPMVTLNTATPTSNSITVPYTMSDTESGLATPTCKYSTTNGSYTTSGTATTTSCTMNDLTPSTTYYYQVCVADKVGNTATCKTGSATVQSAGVLINPVITYINTPETKQNGYLKSQVANVTFDSNGIESPQYFIKTSRAGTSSLTVTSSCGTSTAPGLCSTVSTTALTANTWYKVSGSVGITYNNASGSEGTIYAMASDGTNYTDTVTDTVSKIDTTSPTVTLSTATTNQNNIIIPYTMSDSESGLATPTCKYSTTNGSYTTNGTATTSNCTLTDLIPGTYYYQVCVADKVGNTATCKTGSAIIEETGTLVNPVISFTNVPSTAVNGYFQSQTANVTFNSGGLVSPQYYIKTSRAGTSNLNVTESCGTSTIPETCTTITETKSLSANTWYKVSGNVDVYYNSTSTTDGTIYAVTSNGTSFSGTTTGTLSKIDLTSPTVTLGTTTSDQTSITVQYTMSDSESGLATPTCKYGTYAGSYEKSATATNTSCTITGLLPNTTYYYQVCVADNIGNDQTCKTGSNSTEQSLTPVFTFTYNPNTPGADSYTSIVVNVKYNTSASGTKYHYVKSTRAATSGSTLYYTCGTGSTPGSCSNSWIGTTSMAANTWYRLGSLITSASEVKVTYKTSASTEATLYAMTSFDGTNGEMVQTTIAKIN